MNAPAEPYDDQGGLLSGTWFGGHGWLIMIIVPLIPMALILGGFAVNDAGHSRQCTSHGGHTDRVGGTFDDIFLVCRDAQNRITKVYADKGGDAEQEAKCASQGGELFKDGGGRVGEVMMCVVDGQVAWSTGK